MVMLIDEGDEGWETEFWIRRAKEKREKREKRMEYKEGKKEGTGKGKMQISIHHVVYVVYVVCGLQYEFR